ncbi:MAG: hypothetical protein ACKO2P_15405 [Planctomycetota bacterium]
MVCRQTSSSALPTLQASWQEWMGILSRFARHGVHTGEFSRQGYRELHARLQGAIDRSLEEMTADVCVLRSMQELSAPWPSLESLAVADRKLLQDLLDRCAALQQTWGGVSDGAAHGRKTATGVALRLLSLAVCVAGILLLVTRRMPGEMSLDARLPFAGVLRTLMRGSWDLQSGIAVACVGVVVVMITWLVFRPPRRY